MWQWLWDWWYSWWPPWPPWHRQRVSDVRIRMRVDHRRLPVGQPATVNVGHQVTCTIQYLDQNGQPMLTTVTPDSPPTWQDSPSPPGAATDVVAADGSTDVVTAVAAGSDTVGVSVTVGGKVFTDSVLITISPAPQVLSSVVILTTVV